MNSQTVSVSQLLSSELEEAANPENWEYKNREEVFSGGEQLYTGSQRYSIEKYGAWFYRGIQKGDYISQEWRHDRSKPWCQYRRKLVQKDPSLLEARPEWISFSLASEGTCRGNYDKNLFAMAVKRFESIASGETRRIINGLETHSDECAYAPNSEGAFGCRTGHGSLYVFNSETRKREMHEIPIARVSRELLALDLIEPHRNVSSWWQYTKEAFIAQMWLQGDSANI